MHALIIEDEALIALAIEDILRKCGFTSFDFAISGDDAVEAAKSNCPDLITADVELNPGNGIETANLICAGPTIPVIFITATPAEVARQMPLHPLIIKPFTDDEVIDAVNVALGWPQRVSN
ncbi:response regulator [Sphingomonas sp. LY160]|uniref:response regulator n=1 Tax=Sphingomonas sp. LY160 TaxID=3095342 RepID=UPI002ADECC96|nr:response regulator [Sphingomonas sp. LY160]MEA1072053.1 response regulator [Sphingomonas sp. LY160]